MPFIRHTQKILESKDLSFRRNPQLLVAMLEACERGRPFFGRRLVQVLRNSAIASAGRANDTGLDEAPAAKMAHGAVGRMRFWFHALLRSKFPSRDLISIFNLESKLDRSRPGGAGDCAEAAGERLLATGAVGGRERRTQLCGEPSRAAGLVQNVAIEDIEK
jgi:hypothetical protein